jgi:replicative DNA helicase
LTTRRDETVLNEILGQLNAEAGDSRPKTLWEAPAPLGLVGRLPAFPVECLTSSWMREFVESLAEALQTPLDLPGMLLLSALAACAGGRVRVEVRSGWEEPLNLYVAVALPPGERKSAAVNEVAAPLIEFEAGRTVEMGPEIAEARAQRKVAEKTLEALQNQAAKAIGGERERLMEEVATAARELEDCAVPASYRLLADDATPEALASLLAEQRGRMAVLSPEGGIFGLMAGRYASTGGQPNLDVYLKAHPGDTLRVDRKGRPPEFIPRPALTLGLAPQPDVVRSLAGEAGFRSRGLLGRFLYSLPISRVGGRDSNAAPLPALVRAGYAREIQALIASLEAQSSATTIKLSLGAEEALVAFDTELEPRLGERGDLGHVSDWACKLTGAVVRLAGLLHLAANVRGRWGDPVSVEAMEAAIGLGRYLIPHALAAFDLMEADSSLAVARRVLEWAAENRLSSFTRRECFAVFRRRVGDRVTGIDPVLELLLEHGYLRREAAPPAGKPGRPRSDGFEVNPIVTKSAESTKPPDSAHFVDCVDSVAEPVGSKAGANGHRDGAGWEEIG